MGGLINVLSVLDSWFDGLKLSPLSLFFILRYQASDVDMFRQLLKTCVFWVPYIHILVHILFSMD